MEQPVRALRFVGLTEKKLPFEVQTVALHEGAQRAPAYVETSFTARVPALVDGAFSLSESSAIVEYLEDKWPPPAHAALLPRDLESARGRARSWPGCAATWCRSARSARPSTSSIPTTARRRTRRSRRRRCARWTKSVGFAERLVPADGGPLFGAWSIADTDLAMMLWRLSRTGHPLPANLRTFADAQWQRPSVREFVLKPRPSPFVAY